MQLNHESDLRRDVSNDQASTNEGRHRRVPAVVWWITALHVSLLLAYPLQLLLEHVHPPLGIVVQEAV